MNTNEKTSSNATIVASIALVISVLSLLSSLLLHPPKPPMQPGPGPDDGQMEAQEYFMRLQNELESMKLTDVQKYGIEVYCVYINATQESMTPEHNFGKDKALKKMQVTYPEANLLRVAEAAQAMAMIMHNDILALEMFLENKTFEKDYCPDLTPNAQRLMPNLLSFLVQYHLEHKNFDEVNKLLDTLELFYRDDYISSMGQGINMPLKVIDFVASQRKLLVIAKENAK